MKPDVYIQNKRSKIGSKIKEIRKKMKLSQLELANIIGISQSHLANIELGRKRISYDLLEKIARALKVSPSFLLEDKTDLPALDEILEKVKLVPVVAAVQAGAPEEAVEYQYAERYFPFVGLKCEGCYVIEVNGDSMYPTLEKGDYILVKPIEKYPFLVPDEFENKIVVAANENWEYTIKRLKRVGEEWILVPDNINYKLIKTDGWKIVGVAIERIPKRKEL